MHVLLKKSGKELILILTFNIGPQIRDQGFSFFEAKNYRECEKKSIERFLIVKNR
jgi:hypothetical protein